MNERIAKIAEQTGRPAETVAPKFRRCTGTSERRAAAPRPSARRHSGTQADDSAANRRRLGPAPAQGGLASESGYLGAARR
jgi:hypothetical protein